MSWVPDPRPPWVEAANRGDVPPIADIARRPLERDALLDEARARLGLDAGDGVGEIDGDGGCLDALDVALEALRSEASLTLVGRWLTRRFLVRLLQVRFQLARYLREDPGVRDTDVAAPLVVTGAPRTGTTVLYGVLACDPAMRAPQGWELLRPVPPPDPARGPDPGRVALAEGELGMLGAVSSGLDAIHPYSARMPKECVSAMSLAFRSEELTARYHVPGYVAYLRDADMDPAYQVHRLVLQVLQRRWPRRRWLLKSPVHLHSLDALFRTYPDARIVVTHRDPMSLLPSVTSLVATLRWAHSDHVDFPAIGRYHVDLYRGDLDRLATLTEEGALDPRRTAHVHNATFAEDPIAAVRAVYAQLGMELTAEGTAAMNTHLAARPSEHRGGHHYSFADLGLDPEEVRAGFRHYQEVFDVAAEHHTDAR